MIGHTEQIVFFNNVLSANKLSHAYLFSGEEGCGKKIFATNLAMSLIDNKSSFYDYSEDFKLYGKDLLSRYPDLHLFDNIDDSKSDFSLNVKSMRNLNEIVRTSSYSGGFTAVIINDAHMLSRGIGESANTILKSLEEPEPNTIFILITHRPALLLDTIKSRCISVSFNSLSTKNLLNILIDINPLTNWEETIDYSCGSAGRAIILNNFGISSFLSCIEKCDNLKVSEQLFTIADKSTLSAVVNSMRVFFIKKYKVDQNDSNAYMVSYLSTFLLNLDYNINLNIQLLDLYTTLFEVLKWQKRL